jgi:uncharacterized protein (DUF488 family)
MRSVEQSDVRPSRVFTIGFTQTTAEAFFERLFDNGVTRVIDVRLWNSSQLSGFAKASDLAWFLGKLGGVDYQHEPLLAPTEDILSAYRKKSLTWSEYEISFRALMRSREIERRLDPTHVVDACLLCSEKQAQRCHRRLVVEYLSERWGKDLKVRHL